MPIYIFTRLVFASHFSNLLRAYAILFRSRIGSVTCTHYRQTPGAPSSRIPHSPAQPARPLSVTLCTVVWSDAPTCSRLQQALYLSSTPSLSAAVSRSDSCILLTSSSVSERSIERYVMR